MSTASPGTGAWQVQDEGMKECEAPHDKRPDCQGGRDRAEAVVINDRLLIRHVMKPLVVVIVGVRIDV
ncbi:hypothetical protein PBY51_001350 [Eleginops maclovinus]|uniref:Uncharacterized protein n=1 Tax=Eleginops maclovinus TaxID=56733 RepID=A0AAN7WXN5_ELEMC|nr:hypothetical protein PBY51_001350 [Eleginops maclovinus]